MQTSIGIAAPVEVVRELVTDLERLGDRVSRHRDFPEPPPAEVKQGISFQQTLAVAGTPFTVEWTAVEVDGPQRQAASSPGMPSTRPAHRSRLKQIAEG